MTILNHSLLWVGLGGFLGSVLRFLIGLKLTQSTSGAFPWGTFTVNLVGSLLIGVLFGLFSHELLSDRGSKLWIVGFCGGFTTFSSFSLDGLRLLQEEQWWYYGLYSAGSIVIGLLLTFCGWILTRLT